MTPTAYAPGPTFHLAQMCVWALCTSVGLFTIAFMSGFVVPPNWAGQAMIALFLAGKVAIVCAWPLTLAALVYSLLCRRKIWIDFAVTPEIVVAGCWPPVIDHKENGAWSAVAFLAIMASFLVGLGLEPFGLVVCIGAAIATLIPLFLLGALTIAHTPADCYPEATSPFSTC